jgi:hypothetical protein
LTRNWYSNRADFKALANATDGLGIADGEVDEDTPSGKRCGFAGRRQKPCRIYAVGNNVVWPDDVMPMPAAGDLRVEPDIPLTADALTFATPEEVRSLAGKVLPAANHKALATIGGGAAWHVFRQRSRAEAVRRVLHEPDPISKDFVTKTGQFINLPPLASKHVWMVRVEGVRPLGSELEPSDPADDRRNAVLHRLRLYI